MDDTRLQSLLSLMRLSDSALPTGAFSHSLGFETYITRGDITDAPSFVCWLRMFVEQQLTFTDAIAVRLVYGCTQFSEVKRLDAMVTAQALPRQVRRSGTTMGARLLHLGASTTDDAWVHTYHDAVTRGEMQAHPATVMGVIARGLGVGVDEAVASHLLSTVISLTQNAVRGIPLGQNAGQRVIHDAQAWVIAAVHLSATLHKDDLGAMTPGLEIAQMEHEQQRARLFMS